MESEENIENTIELDKEVKMDENDEVGPELHDKTDSGEDHEQDVVSPEDPGPEITTAEDEESTPQDDESTEVKTPSADAEEVSLTHPKPEIALQNPLLKSVMEITPPTPRNSSPLQIAIDKIHPSKIDDDDHLSSPTGRKEEEVQLPTGICEFHVASKDDNDTKTEEDVEPPAIENKEEESEPIKPENMEEHQETLQETEAVEQPGRYEVPGPKEEEEVIAPETGEHVDTEPPEHNNDEEFVVVSPEDAPIEFAEEYPPIQTETETPATADEMEEASHETEPATEDPLTETPDNDAEVHVIKEEGEPMKTVELPEEEHSPEVETQEPGHEQNDIIETEHNEMPRESEPPTIGEDVTDVPTEERTPEAIGVRADALPLDNEDPVDPPAEFMDDVPITDDIKEVEMDDIEAKEPEEKGVDEESEIVEPDDNPMTSEPTPSDVHPTEETVETTEENLSPAHETEPIESTPEIADITELQTEESQPEMDPVHEHNEDADIVENGEIPEEAEASSSEKHEDLPMKAVDDVLPEPSPPSDLDGPIAEDSSVPFGHTVEDPIGEAKEQNMDEIEPPVERANESPDESPFDTQHEQSGEDDTQQSVEADLEKSVPEEPTHEVVDESVMPEPLEVESHPYEHPVDQPGQESAIGVVGQDEEHREQASEEPVEQESSSAEQSEGPGSHESVEQVDEQPVLTTEGTSNEEEQLDPLEQLEEIPEAPAAAQPEEHPSTEEELSEETAAHQGDETAAKKSIEEHQQSSADDVDFTNNVPETHHLDELGKENISSQIGQDEIDEGQTEATTEVHSPDDVHETSETQVITAPEESSKDVPVTDSLDDQPTVDIVPEEEHFDSGDKEESSEQAAPVDVSDEHFVDQHPPGEEESQHVETDNVDPTTVRDSPPEDVLTSDDVMDGTSAPAVDVEESPALDLPVEDVAEADRDVPKSEDVEMVSEEPVIEVENDEVAGEDILPTEVSPEKATAEADEMDNVQTETPVKEETAPTDHTSENTEERDIMPEIAGGVGLAAAAVAQSHEADDSEVKESGLEDVEKEDVPGLHHEEFAPDISVEPEKEQDERHETPSFDDKMADEPGVSEPVQEPSLETPEHVVDDILTKPESDTHQQSSELEEEISDPHLETAEVVPEPVSLESVEQEKQDSAHALSGDIVAPVEHEALSVDVEEEKDTPIEQAEFTPETAADEVLHEVPSETEPVHEEVKDVPPVNPDESLEDSESATEINDITITPVETILQGTVAPPSTPLATRIAVVTAAGIVGTSVHTITEDQLKEEVPREGYLGRSVHVEDESNVQSPEAEDGATLDDVTDADSVFDLPQTVERVDVSSQKVATKPAVQPPSSMEPIHDSAIASKAEPPSIGGTSDSKEIINVEEAVVAIPTTVAAGSVGIMAMATHQKSDQQNTTPIDDSIPLIRVDTPKPPTLEVHGPFIEPLKHHVQPDEISPPTPTVLHSPTLDSPVIPIPREPTHLPPAARPVTSYSWLGALFQPISSDVVEAQRTGWVAISTEIVNEPSVRKSPTRLRKKTKDVVEQVSLRGQKMSDHQGSQTSTRMWNYVREKTFKKGRKRVSGWFKRGGTMEA